MRKLFPLALLTTVACGGAAANVPCPQTPAANATPTPTPNAPPTSTSSLNTSPASLPLPPPALTLLLRPIATPSPIVHVEIDLAAQDKPPTVFRLLRGAPDHLANASARDDSGDLGVTVAAREDGLDLTLARAPKGSVHVAYDVVARGDAPDDPLGLLVLDDRFRGSGEELVALPASIEADMLPVLVKIDGDPLRATCASSFGVGNARRTTLPPRALRFATYLAGSLGAMEIDDPAAGHDEGVWLGYTAFDPRPAVAELAQTRTGLRDYFKSGYQVPWTHIFVSQTRPIGSFSTNARAMSELLQVGPSEPWSAALRLSLTQHLARRWVGSEIAIDSGPGKSAEAWWFGEGVARYVAMHVLALEGFMTPDDLRDAVSGELSVLATSPDRALGNVELAALARTDGVARATLTARGALYALRESVAIRARTKGAHDLRDTLAALMTDAQENQKHVIPVSAWIDRVAKDDPDAAKTFDALVVKGAPIALPADAMGPCFRAGTGEYVAYDPGFDVDATKIATDAKIVGLRKDGPAAKAGVKEGDVLESMKTRDGDASVGVKMVVVREGKKVEIGYLPRGAHGKGQTWTRVRGVPDEKCGEAP